MKLQRYIIEHVGKDLTGVRTTYLLDMVCNFVWLLGVGADDLHGRLSQIRWQILMQRLPIQ
jgi:hypothetical protein